MVKTIDKPRIAWYNIVKIRDERHLTRLKGIVIIMTVRTYQYVDEEIKYVEDYVIGEDYETVDDLKEELDELVGLAIDRYEIEEI